MTESNSFKTMPSVQNHTSSTTPISEEERMKDESVIDALEYYLRQRALTQRAFLPQWASW